mmetsp:Transcript_9135/g.19154  ORF Transcript_9135/g.19154 Transcript_9135/m.19154 type:complete len:228 (-) Transcript_9135:369-1052(-)|eukprot:CAMPEP_0201162338 /NCGR_PEP_ID=MMETSP0851-20130426/51759_1 /ASSEMBLY_ACC=CAM_ASM_000631 /TAXON_ID=183588 /ORGANISM="Pseudo-nitzschia fraudulenta, Strain WWA7" /LENGTH=227 /DNA_ID=CAMNT_0047442119 /DNA_START=33 /DNA_END=716 /DNA_ORIENTATION=+
MRTISPFSIVHWLVVGCLIPASVASCPGFSLGTTSCSSGIFSSSSISASCSDNGEVAISGTVTAPSSFEDAKVTFVPCIRSTGVCFDEYAQDGGKVCDLISSTSGSECGSAGEYQIDQEFDIPDEVTNHSWAMAFVTIKVLINNEEACTQNATSDSSSAFMATGMASLFAVGGLSLYFMRRRKRPLLVLDETMYGERRIAGFVEMNDLSPSVSSIGNMGAISFSGIV